jgi:tRNA(fMet)-specific endonuclease VapC
MIYCLDTNTVVYFLKGTYPGLATRLKRRTPASIRIPEIVRAELLYGVEKSVHKERNRELLDNFLSVFEWVPFSGEAVDCYARIRADLESCGEPIGPNDLIVAATALSIGATLVTRKTREFARVKGLKIADWMQ